MSVGRLRGSRPYLTTLVPESGGRGGHPRDYAPVTPTDGVLSVENGPSTVVPILVSEDCRSGLRGRPLGGAPRVETASESQGRHESSHDHTSGVTHPGVARPRVRTKGANAGRDVHRADGTKRAQREHRRVGTQVDTTKDRVFGTSLPRNVPTQGTGHGPGTPW